MPRINHTYPIYYRDWVIPPHTAISMSLRDVHLDASVFKNPRQFQPERWLNDSSKKELYETTEEDIRLTHDFFSLDASKEAQGLRVLIKWSHGLLC